MIGDALKDNPVSNILGDFREDVLQELVNKLRASNANLEGLIGLIENALDDAFMFDTDGDDLDDFNALTLPTFAVFGVPEPLPTPAAFRSSTAAGGVFVINVKLRSL